MRALRRALPLSLWLGLLAPAAALTASSSTAVAQTAPQVTSQVSDTEVEVGEAFTIELKAMSEAGETVSDPKLRTPSGFSVSGPMISTQSYMQFGSGGRHVQQGIGATWSLVASAPGSYNIPAPTVVWNGKRLQGSPVTIKVVPQGSKPQRRQGGFLFPGGMPGGSVLGPNWPFGSMEPDESDPDEGREEPGLTLPRAPANDIFLHAVADKTNVVVGEQVTISVYRYFKPASVAGITDNTSMRLEDFLRFTLPRDPTQIVVRARAGDQRFSARLVEKYFAFPLRTGALKTGSLLETYAPYRRGPSFRRASEDLTIQVTEPPAANRPVGYKIGDVGQFMVSSLVQPRRVEEGGSVAVTVKISGSGNFPTSLGVPEKTGIEWLDPEKKESIEPRNGELSGFRSFGYVVRLTKRGTVDIGTIELPYWNARARRYEVARSALGTVEVVPGANAPAVPSAAPSAGGDKDKDEAFATLPPPRTALSAFAVAPQSTLLEGWRFPGALVAPPFLALAGIAGASLSRRARSRLAERKVSPRTLAAAALADAKQAKSKGDERAAAAAVERAIVLAIEAASSVKARGVLKEELARELRANGIGASVADRASDALAACDRARFDPLAAAEVRIEDAEVLVRDLLQAKAT